MGLLHNRALILSTLEARKTQAFTAYELSEITSIPLTTLRSILRHMVHERFIFKTTTTVPGWNKRKTERIEKPCVWFHITEVIQPTSPLE
jgi:transcription initiation factor IIE alpha subunit